MTRISHLLPRLAMLALAATVLALAGCGGVKDSAARTKMEKNFDMVVQSYKDGQFLLGGAVLSPMDLGGHFSYLRDQGKLPKRVLLVRSDDAKIRTTQIQAMAYIEAKYGVATYYDDKGELRRIKVSDAKSLQYLKDRHEGAPLPDRIKEGSARGRNHFPTGG
jgi:hypothetical protein